DTPTDTPTATNTPSPTATNTPVCQVSAMSTDVPKSIPDSFVAQSTLNMTGIGTISDIDLVGLNISHTSISDLEVDLTSPDNTTVALIVQICGSEDNFTNITLDDGAAQSIGAVCPPTPGGTFRPGSP